MNENDVIQSVLKGEKENYRLIVDNYKDKLYTYLFYMCKDTYIAEDLLQETFIKAFLRLDTYSPSKSKFYTWLSTIAYNVFIDYKRKNKIVFLELNTEVEMGTYEDKIDNEDLNYYLLSIKEEYRQIMVLHYFNDLSYKEISELLGMSINTIKTNISRGKKILRELIGKEMNCINE